MGRFDKIKYHNGTSWLSPSQIKVFNGTSWVDYGTATSFNTNAIKAYDAATWLRFTRDRLDTPSYPAASKNFPYAVFGTSQAISLSNGEWTWSVKRQVGALWDAWLWMALDNSLTTYGWAGTDANNDSSEDWIMLTWTTPRWIEKVRFGTCNSAYYSSTPHRAEVSFRNADGTWTAEATYTIPTNSYTAKSAWGTNYFVFNKQSAAGYTGFKMRFLNNTTYHVGTSATRFGEIEVWLGWINITTTWV